MATSSRSPGPTWFDESNRKTCDHDRDQYPPERVRKYIGYSDFGYFRSECGHPECDEKWDWYIEG